MRRRTSFLVWFVVALTVMGTAPWPAVATEWVEIGNPGNLPDPLTGRGAVNYTYRISKHKVTQTEYMEFLNAVAATEDTHGLYESRMRSGHGCGIVFDGEKYTLKPPAEGFGPGGTSDYDFANKPIAYVSFFDAVRYVNWLHNGKPSGLQGESTTENGAYNLSDLTGGTHAVYGASGRNADAEYWLPTWDEWYKAAYYDPTLNAGAGGYYLYPTSSNLPPDNNPPDLDSGNSANYNLATGIRAFAYTDVDAYAQSASPYGVLGMAGNVVEKIEDPLDGERFSLGGSWFSTDPVCASSLYEPHGSALTYGEGVNGFRIATVPEPGAAVLLAAAGGCLLPSLVRRKRRHRQF